MAKRIIAAISGLVCSAALLTLAFFGVVRFSPGPVGMGWTDTTDMIAFPETSGSSDVLQTEPSEPDGSLNLSGVISTSTGTPLALIIEWSARRSEKGEPFFVSADVYLEYGRLYMGKKELCSVSINGEAESFVCPAVKEEDEGAHRSLLHSFSKEIEPYDGESFTFEIEANMNVNIFYSGTAIKDLCAKGQVNINDEVISLPLCAKIDVENIMQYPELPNGCEITSLTILLRHLGFDVDKLTMCDEYLDKGPIGETSYYRANIGDPRDEYSYGCYSPVIVNAANKYLESVSSPYTARDLTGHDISEVYAEVAAGRPVAVWITMENDAEPYNIIGWDIDGETIYWKHPLHCVVLTGYDKEEGTVFTADPIEGDLAHDMALFELRWVQMGAQAVSIISAR